MSNSVPKIMKKERKNPNFSAVVKAIKAPTNEKKTYNSGTKGRGFKASKLN